MFDAVAPVRKAPVPDAMLETEALQGERVTVYDENGEGWAWGQLHGDGYVGWLPMNALRAPGRSRPTRSRCCVRILFPGRSIKAPPVEGLPLGSRLAVAGQDGDLARLASGGYVPARHLAPLDAAAAGISSPSPSVSSACLICGAARRASASTAPASFRCRSPPAASCARATATCRRALGAAVAADATLARGDLVFWKGHVGMMRDAATLLHANAFHMAVTSEPLTEAAARISAAGSDVVAIKRL